MTEDGKAEGQVSEAAQRVADALIPCGDTRGMGFCKNPANPDHTCPFRDDIYDDQTICNCCDNCTHECAMDV